MGGETLPIFDSLDSVWRWGSDQVGSSYSRLFHPNCFSQPQTVSSPVVVAAPVPPPVLPTISEAMVRVSGFTRLAGLSGAAAVALGAYGAHVIGTDPDKVNLKKAFDTASQYHLVHSVALLAVPLARLPRVSGCLFLGGMGVFCGTTYYHALTGDIALRKYTPYGGVMLILAWLSLVL